MNLSPHREPSIFSPRLELVHLSAEEMRIIVEDDDSSVVWHGKTFTNPYGILIGDAGPLHWRLPQVYKDQMSNKWFVRLIIEQDTRQVVGTTSFHEPPSTEGLLEIGIEIVQEKQRKGFATEALIAMWTWALTHDEVKTLRYCVGESNVASIALIEKLGFHRVGIQNDEIDGPEFIYEISDGEFRQKFLS